MLPYAPLFPLEYAAWAESTILRFAMAVASLACPRARFSSSTRLHAVEEPTAISVANPKRMIRTLSLR